MARGSEGDSDGSGGGVQSVKRALQIMNMIADTGAPCGLSELASATGLPIATIHRLLRTLIGAGMLRQEPDRRYALGSALIHLGDQALSMIAPLVRPHLATLVDILGETANAARLEGTQIVYLAQVPSRHQMRMFTEVGRRVEAYRTAVGKAMLAQLDDQVIAEVYANTKFVATTPTTITDLDDLMRELRTIREHGYAIDDGEQEVGVRCVAVAVAGPPGTLALSVSGPTARINDSLVAKAVPLLQQSSSAIAAANRASYAGPPTPRAPR
ncbi:IclR family transcriptional regulator [Micromonospora sp. NBC_01638]|uniref:IclR family transcriptional regulator n=1 Tax=Micromonospora sp. NBC_01638 TaxID=2975982 RepID=UPI00386AFB31|nr:IclR family transcriptional regulator [Micromonospora sp. NBC_01638]